MLLTHRRHPVGKPAKVFGADPDELAGSVEPHGFAVGDTETQRVFDGEIDVGPRTIVAGGLTQTVFHAAHVGGHQDRQIATGPAGR
jgi:hypothetical protein